VTSSGGAAPARGGSRSRIVTQGTVGTGRWAVQAYAENSFGTASGSRLSRVLDRLE